MLKLEAFLSFLFKREKEKVLETKAGDSERVGGTRERGTIQSHRGNWAKRDKGSGRGRGTENVVLETDAGDRGRGVMKWGLGTRVELLDSELGKDGSVTRTREGEGN